MILPGTLEAEFWQEFKQFEQERRMSYITTGERIGYERGQQEQAQNLVLRQLQKRFGELPNLCGSKFNHYLQINWKS